MSILRRKIEYNSFWSCDLPLIFTQVSVSHLCIEKEPEVKCGINFQLIAPTLLNSENSQHQQHILPYLYKNVYIDNYTVFVWTTTS